MMKKTTLKIASAAVAALSVFSLSASASAAGTEHSQSFALIDDANLFDDTQYASLCEKLSSVGSQTGWQIAVVTTDYGISSSRMDSYYNDLYDNNREYFEADSALFVIDNASSNRLILTHGTAEMYFTDERLSDMKSALKPSLSSGDMETAVEIFADKNLEYFEEGVVNGHHSNHVEGQSEEELAAQREKESTSSPGRSPTGAGSLPSSPSRRAVSSPASMSADTSSTARAAPITSRKTAP